MDEEMTKEIIAADEPEVRLDVPMDSYIAGYEDDDGTPYWGSHDVKDRLAHSFGNGGETAAMRWGTAVHAFAAAELGGEPFAMVEPPLGPRGGAAKRDSKAWEEALPAIEEAHGEGRFHVMSPAESAAWPRLRASLDAHLARLRKDWEVVAVEPTILLGHKALAFAAHQSGDDTWQLMNADGSTIDASWQARRGLAWRFLGAHKEFNLKARPDLVLRSKKVPGELRIVDWKTASRAGSPSDLHRQAVALDYHFSMAYYGLAVGAASVLGLGPFKEKEEPRSYELAYILESGAVSFEYSTATAATLSPILRGDDALFAKKWRDGTSFAQRRAIGEPAVFENYGLE